MPARTSGPQDAKGVPLRPLGPGGRLVYNPTVLAQQGLKHLDSWRRTGLRVHLGHARAIAGVLESQARTRGGRRWQFHRYDRHGQGLESPWVNANSHGLTLSFLSRYHELEGGDRKLAAAEELMAAFERRPRHRLWFSMVRDRRVWFEHWPDGRQRQVLNGHINAVLGLYDYWLVSRSKGAERYIQGGLATVRGKLRLFRRPGQLSRYSITSPTYTLHYHRTHIHQLGALARISGDPWFRRQARRFRSDERAWLVRSAAANTP
ncbi:hypothetical protein BH23CHL8_BH23CHL8_02700 [soil metagenome]